MSSSRMKLCHPIVTGLVLLLLIACGESAPRGEDAIVRDSAGVRIVMNRTPRLGVESWHMGRMPVTILGASDDDPLLNVRGAVRLSDGRIVVGNGGLKQLNYYGPDGSLLFHVGREGGGPGEFSGPVGFTNVWRLPGDTVAVWEHSATRLSRFDPEGNFVRVERMEPVAARFPQVVGLATDGIPVAFHMSDRRPNYDGERFRDSLEFVAYEPEAGTWAELARLPGIESMGVEFRGRVTLGVVPFGRRHVTVVAGDRFYYGANDGYEVAVYDFAGQLKMLIQRTLDARPVEAADVEADKERRLAGVPDADMRAEWRRAMDRVEYPETYPPYSRMVVDQTGNLWVRGYVSPRDTVARWSVFDSDGVWVTDVGMSPELQVFEIGTDYVLGLERDEFDVEHVVMYDVVSVATESALPHRSQS